MITLSEAIQEHMGFDIHRVVDDETNNVLWEMGSSTNPSEEVKNATLVQVTGKDKDNKTLYVLVGHWFVPSDWRHGR